MMKVISLKPTVELTAGSADFTQYVAVGASFTAGFADGALFIGESGKFFSQHPFRANSPELGSGELTQPLMADNNGGLLLGGLQIANPRLFFNGAGTGAFGCHAHKPK